MSTPSEPPQPQDDPALEPIRVLRPRRTDALADLMREFREQTGPVSKGPAFGGRRPVAPAGPPAGSEERTEELPPLTRASGDRRAGPGAGPGTGRRWAAVVVAVAAAGVLGFGGAVLLSGKNAGDQEAPDPRPPASAPDRTAGPTASAPDRVPSPTASVPDRVPSPTASAPGRAPSPTASAPPPAQPAIPPVADPDGPGTLREGASGPEVSELQQRLLRIPDVYRDGSTSGRYDSTLTAAVARFQLWYGIRGDESGVYGDDTRAALESRTAVGTG
ncbi:peptidoglycan-binding protein [Streptomyces sp. NPDC019990]|uniref:peptidoglycan-binding domain-containing protein n=1 Tax=Streptomyces sp. NPDC019990 TaxID=3154693 RepID=UPI0033C9C6F0